MRNIQTVEVGVEVDSSQLKKLSLLLEEISEKLDKFYHECPFCGQPGVKLSTCEHCGGPIH